MRKGLCFGGAVHQAGGDSLEKKKKWVSKGKNK